MLFRSDRQKILFGFSDSIRAFICDSDDKIEASILAEKITYVFDELNNRNHISNDGLRSLVDKLEAKLKVMRL